MSNDRKPLPDSERLRLGRLIFDGAEASLLAERHGLTVTEVDDAWLYCRERLSQHFAKGDDRPPPLLADAEFQSRAIDCLRLLLDWRDALITQQKVEQFGLDSSTPEQDSNSADSSSILNG